MSARDDLFRRVAGAFIDESRANALHPVPTDDGHLAEYRHWLHDTDPDRAAAHHRPDQATQGGVMTTSIDPRAVVGRHVTYTFYRDPNATLPGIITAITSDEPVLRVRLDGQRCNLAVPPDYEGLNYLDTITDVPTLPMGRFTPTADTLKAETYEGVPVIGLEDDTVILTADRDLAVRALAAYGKAHDWYGDDLSDKDLKPRWVAFDWEPEDAECPWLMTFTEEGDDMAVQVHYLPA